MEALMLAVYVHKMNADQEAGSVRQSRSYRGLKGSGAVLASVTATLATLGLGAGLSH